jgi:hypothetical protein
MNQRISTLRAAPSTSGSFLSKLLHDRLGPNASFNVKIIDDNARTGVTKKRHIIGEKRKLSRERHDKAQLHIASRWGESIDVNQYDRHEDAELRPIPTRSELVLKEVTTEGASSTAGANDRWSITSFETGTIQSLDGAREAGSNDIHSSSTWSYSVLPLSDLQCPYSNDVNTLFHGKNVGCKYTRVLHLTEKAVSISTSSPRLPRRRKSYTETFCPGSEAKPMFIKQSPAVT